MKDRVLLIGSGAREHAVAKAFNNSNAQIELHCIGSNINPGISNLCIDYVVDDYNNPDIVSEYAKRVKPYLAFIGPENPLEAGIADSLWNLGVKVVGPKRELARVETSKAFARDLATEYNIPGTGKYRTFKSIDGVKDFLEKLGNNYVIKFDGLAGGKGVKVSGDHLNSYKDAMKYCKSIIARNGTFVIEEKFIGEEFSLMSFCDGLTLKHMPAVQDHKRAYENDKGPNTGGMGTYSDSNHSLPFLTSKDIQDAMEINTKTAVALKRKFVEGYKGILYGGFMATSSGVKLIEYNARFGDPEAMNILSILDTDFIDICNAIVDGKLNDLDIQFKNKATVCKYAVPNGYPDNPVKGEKIDISRVIDTNRLFLASVDVRSGTLVESGSRTIAFVGVSDTIKEAEKIAEKEIACISGPLFHRKDIGTDKLIKKRMKNMESLR